jgi:hypothetical protein
LNVDPNRSRLALTEAELRLIQSVILPGDENESFGSIGDQPITRRDIRTLRGLTWLNDEVRRLSGECDMILPFRW